jgi:hypothetical protein
VLESLGSEPGEWYYDHGVGKLYYVPMPGETIATNDAVLPVTYQFLRFNGVPEEGKFVANLAFRGLTFRYADWVQPEQNGKYFDPYLSEEKWRPQDSTSQIMAFYRPVNKMAGTAQSAIYAPGVISLVGTRNVAILDSRIEHTGFFGINLAEGCQHNTLEGNVLTDLGGGGVKIDGPEYPSPAAKFTGENRVTDNVVRGGGRVFMSAPGVIVTHGFSNLIAHNEISDFYQIGISVGWEWGREPTVSRDNRIEYNHIFHLGQGLSSDLAGVYTLGVQPGTMVRYNLIHDVRHKQCGGWGVYTAGGSANILIESNIIHDVSAQAIISNAVDDFPGNRKTIVRNNILAFGREGGTRMPDTYDWKGRNIPGKAATYERNIFIGDGVPAYVSEVTRTEAHPKNDIFITNLNLFWDVSGETPLLSQEYRAPLSSQAKTVLPSAKHEPQGLTWEQWQALGSDRHSKVADPRFRDWKKRDFTLSADSPAFDLGFEPIDLTTVGPRAVGKRD